MLLVLEQRQRLNDASAVCTGFSHTRHGPYEFYPLPGNELVERCWFDQRQSRLPRLSLATSSPYSTVLKHSAAPVSPCSQAPSLFFLRCIHRPCLLGRLQCVENLVKKDHTASELAACRRGRSACLWCCFSTQCVVVAHLSRVKTHTQPAPHTQHTLPPSASRFHTERWPLTPYPPPHPATAANARTHAMHAAAPRLEKVESPAGRSC